MSPQTHSNPRIIETTAMYARCRAALHMTESEASAEGRGLAVIREQARITIVVEPLWTTVLIQDPEGYRMVQVDTADLAAFDSQIAPLIDPGTTH
jgi:hypothetical protein